MLPYDPTDPGTRIKNFSTHYKVKQNPKFDPHISGTRVNLTRGRIVQDYNNRDISVVGNTVYILNFLYNPDSIEVDYSIDTSDATPLQPQYRNPNDTANLPIPLANTLSFSLLFDRTYEMWNGTSSAGVYDDVATLYGLIGVTSTVDSPIFDSTGNKTDKTASVTGPMQMNQNYFYFGGQNSLSYYGIIMSASITYTHWTQDMIPVRCTVSLNVNLLATDSTIQKALTVPDRNTSQFYNNSSNYNYFFYSYNGPNQGQ